uniref:Uncharacterized protein n=1 Tax=candidate division WOR-3 bacterium TaxID=2052148 RepID=A0A7C4YHZ0_UNCW3
MRKYIKTMLIEIKLVFNYRFSVMWNSTMLVVPLLGYTFLFKKLFSQDFSFGDYELNTIFTYYFWALFLYTIVPAYAWSDMADNIESGSICYFLSKPYSFLLHYYFQILGASILWIILNFLPLIPFILFFHKLFIFPNLKDLLIGILFFIISYNLALIFGFILQLTTFYIGKPYGYFSIYGWIIGLLGGEIIPVDILPKFFNHLPFRFLYFIPSKGFMGKLENIHILILEGFLYIIIFGFILYLLWKNGLKKYTTFGG